MRYAAGWRDLDVVWMPSGGHREEAQRAPGEIDHLKAL